MATRRVSQELSLDYGDISDLRRCPAKQTPIPHTHKLPATEGKWWKGKRPAHDPPMLRLTVRPSTHRAGEMAALPSQRRTGKQALRASPAAPPLDRWGRSRSTKQRQPKADRSNTGRLIGKARAQSSIQDGRNYGH
ncbi:Hypothetical predicted protein [Pelobates cultripes]|uniref:Uncharacterized protein n=1 Tax=Pelobates cultripes TaxID=61616 RepID=A0AAD1T0W8_PELCU|nr:Hypothetical predicted protein [Pelobates cultripes]